MDKRPIKVLLVDDDEDDYVIARDLLAEIEGEEFELDWVATYDAGLEAIMRGQHDVYLLDYRLDRRNGLELLRQAVENGCEAPLILLTGQGDRAIDVQAMKAGAADYLIKGQIEAPLLERSIRYALEQARTLQALRESEERFRRLVELSPEMIGVHRQGKMLYVNPAGAKLMGAADPADWAGHSIVDYFHPDSRETVEQRIWPPQGGEISTSSCEATVVRLDGGMVDVEVRAAAITYDGEPAVQVVVSDITERKQAEQALRRRNRELALLNRLIAASAGDPEQGSILETACRELAHALDVPQVAAALLNEEKSESIVVAEYLADGQPTALHKKLPVAGNPAMQYLLTRKAPLVADDAQRDPRLVPMRRMLRRRGIVSLLVLPLIIDGDVVGSLGLGACGPRRFSAEEFNLAWSVADQVAGALARAQLSAERQQLTTAITQAAESVIITDPDGVIAYVNPAFEHITGYNRAEVLGRNPRLLSSGKQDKAFYEKLWATIQAGQVWHGRFVNRKKDGALYTSDATITPVRNGSDRIVNYVQVSRDVTHELQLEEQYRQSQKMEALGRLTGGIAHDFNNLLTAINGFAELLQTQLLADDPRRDLAIKILHSGRRAAALVRQLLTFSRHQVIEPKVLDLNVVVANMETMLRRVIGEDVELETRLAPDPWPVKVDPVQIEQVIVNLAVNARDAMPDGGRLTIETARVVLDDASRDAADLLELQPGEYLLLGVTDTGTGMTEEVMAHIFEPFFTTKGVGKGTGLGLATVFGIVKQSGGNIRAFSEEGRGTTFKIYLPRAQEAPVQPGRTEVEVEMPRGDETIFLVEDDPAVRELTRRVLQAQGYTLLEAQDGSDALRVAADYADPIHLLLTDVVMPNTNGKTLATKLVESRPGLKVLFISGYTDKAIVHHGVLEPGVAFLPKPFSPMVLTRAVRTVLDGGSRDDWVGLER